MGVDEKKGMRMLAGIRCAVLGLLLLSGISCGSEPADKVDYAQGYLFLDGKLNPVSAYGKFALGSYTLKHPDAGVTCRIRQTSVDESGGVRAPSPVYVTGHPTTFEQCGTYEFIISHNGDVTRISDFKYSGERNIEVARGIGWSLCITRNDWRH